LGRTVIGDVLNARQELPLCPRFQTYWCLAANDVQGQKETSRLNNRIAVWDDLASPQLCDFCWFFGDVLWRMRMRWEDNSKAPAILKVEMNHWFVRVPSKRSRMRDRWPPIKIIVPSAWSCKRAGTSGGRSLLREAL
jgi:hypothetical protein